MLKTHILKKIKMIEKRVIGVKFSFIQPKLSEGALEMCSNAWPPLGILYCSTVLKNEGFEVSVLDQAAKGYTTMQTRDWVKRENPDILGISVLSSSSKEAGEIAGLVKKENPNLLVVFGNYHSTFNADRILRKYPYVDIVVRGEGEYTSLELAKCLQNGEKIKTVNGITYRVNKRKIKTTPEKSLIKDVDSLPFPDRRLVDCEYTSRIFGIRTATKRFTSLLSSRGCPFHCTFCACRNFARGIWRPRSVENIVKELEFLHSEGYREFLFVDDNFTLNPRRITKLCRKLRKKKLKVEWFCDSRVDNCGFNTFREMVKAGCRTLYFGIESANQRILNYYKKNISPAQSKTAVRNARKAGVDIIVGSFIVGAPDETREEIKKTLEFAQKIDIDVPSFNILGAPVGSPLWNELVAKGFIDEDKHWEEGAYVPRVVPTAVQFEEISEMIFNYFKSFYFNPRKLCSEIVRMFTSSFRLGLLMANAAQLRQTLENVKRGVQFK
ncbi:MAG: radical SAM protein [Candidatus Bathyarchaeota archaeon]|nr:MAG: radical SAM protein [Candidatus Bathyarchaeota archaeon]